MGIRIIYQHQKLIVVRGSRIPVTNQQTINENLNSFHLSSLPTNLSQQRTPNLSMRNFCGGSKKLHCVLLTPLPTGWDFASKNVKGAQWYQTVRAGGRHSIVGMTGIVIIGTMTDISYCPRPIAAIHVAIIENEKTILQLRKKWIIRGQKKRAELRRGCDKTVSDRWWKYTTPWIEPRKR